VLRDQTIPTSANGLIQQMMTQERALGSQVATQSRDLQQIPTRTITEQRLTRDQLSAVTLYTTLSTRYEEAKLALASSIPDVKVLDPAVPPRSPESNSAPRIVLLGLLASLGGRCAGHPARPDRQAVPVPRSGHEELGLTILGAVPAIKRIARASRPHATAQAVILPHHSAQPGALVRVGARPADHQARPERGQVARCQTHLLAGAGYKTLLIDGDIRRGSLNLTSPSIGNPDCSTTRGERRRAGHSAGDPPGAP
jgi:hypothetical protein